MQHITVRRHHIIQRDSTVEPKNVIHLNKRTTKSARTLVGNEESVEDVLQPIRDRQNCEVFGGRKKKKKDKKIYT